MPEDTDSQLGRVQMPPDSQEVQMQVFHLHCMWPIVRLWFKVLQGCQEAPDEWKTEVSPVTLHTRTGQPGSGSRFCHSEFSFQLIFRGYAEGQEKHYIQHVQYLLSSMVEAVSWFGDAWLLLVLVISLSAMVHWTLPSIMPFSKLTCSILSVHCSVEVKTGCLIKIMPLATHPVPVELGFRSTVSRS